MAYTCNLLTDCSFFWFYCIKAPQDSVGSSSLILRGNLDRLPISSSSSYYHLFLLLLFHVLVYCAELLIVLANRLGNVAVLTDVFSKLKGNIYKWSFHTFFPWKMTMHKNELCFFSDNAFLFSSLVRFIFPTRTGNINFFFLHTF